MRKIRTIKPEALEDRCTACLSHEAFRLWVGLTLLADDDGLVRATPGYLLGAVFWGQPPETPLDELIAELAAAQLAQPYNAEGDDYLALTRWRQHQRITSPHPSSLPRPPSMAPAAGAVARGGRGAVVRLARRPRRDEQNLLKDEQDVLNDEQDLLNDEQILLKTEHEADEQHLLNEQHDEQNLLKIEQNMLNDEQKVLKNEQDLLKNEQKVLNDEQILLKNLHIEQTSLDRRGEEWIGKDRNGEDRIKTLAQPGSAAAAQRLSSEQLEQVYQRFPRKVGRLRGLKALSKVRASRFPELLRAVDNYAASQAGKELQYVKQFSTWAGEWEDWISYVEPPRRLSRGITISPPATHTHDVDLGSVLV